MFMAQFPWDRPDEKAEIVDHLKIIVLRYPLSTLIQAHCSDDIVLRPHWNAQSAHPHSPAR
jgi:hypothetical protein